MSNVYTALVRISARDEADEHPDKIVLFQFLSNSGKLVADYLKAWNWFHEGKDPSIYTHRSGWIVGEAEWLAFLREIPENLEYDYCFSGLGCPQEGK